MRGEKIGGVAIARETRVLWQDQGADDRGRLVKDDHGRLVEESDWRKALRAIVDGGAGRRWGRRVQQQSLVGPCNAEERSMVGGAEDDRGEEAVIVGRSAAMHATSTLLGGSANSGATLAASVGNKDPGVGEGIMGRA
ncbi:hypothetical protein L7F22_036752 [Adiantum nelumboides]|nr:hypothetical protein [Adiantum nelumboides]